MSGSSRPRRFRASLCSVSRVTVKPAQWPPGPGAIEQVTAFVIELEIAATDRRPVDPGRIHSQIGRRPIAAFGNSDGDQQMLEWTTAGRGPRFALVLHHDDGEREFAYDRKSRIGTLDKAWDEAVAKGWTVVSMKDDWRVIFPPVTR